MQKTFRALLSEQFEGKVTTQLKTLPTSDLPPGEVLIRAEFSSLNYKDALGVTGKGKIFKKWPMIGGIDVAGSVLESSSPHFKQGEKVLVTGCELGESFWGGFSELVRVSENIVVPLPSGLTTKESMIIGTAGFTAALCAWRFLKNDQIPEMGPIAVTGASGGVGSFSIQILSQLGFEVLAVSGRKEHHEYLRSLGAHDCKTPEELELGQRPLESVKFGGVVDNVGGDLLAALLRHVQLWGNVGCIGLAGGAHFQSTVMPHILRGVSLLGISSNNCLRKTRLEIWKNLSSSWKPKDLNKIESQEITLDQVVEKSHDLLNRKLSGRILVKI